MSGGINYSSEQNTCYYIGMLPCSRAACYLTSVLNITILEIECHIFPRCLSAMPSFIMALRYNLNRNNLIDFGSLLNAHFIVK